MTFARPGWSWVTGSDTPKAKLDHAFREAVGPVASPGVVLAGESHGLGLAVVEAVALMRGGSVHARCEDGEIVIDFLLRKQDRKETPASARAGAAGADRRLADAE